jgi:glycosyltransferase involved in cell wall biosynthesis
MRITFVLPYAGMAGGIRVLAIYADRLMKRGHEVLVLSQPLRRFSLPTKLWSVAAGRGWPQDWKPTPSFFSNLPVPHRVLESRRDVTAADMPDGDVVLATHWSVARMVQALPASKGAKAILMQGYEAPPGEEIPELDASWRMDFHKIVISHWLVDLAREKFGDAQVSHVPNAVDMEQFHAPRRGKQPRPTVGLLYSHSPFKTVGVSLKAFELAAAKVSGLRMVAFGADEPNPEYPLPPGTTFVHRPAQEAIRNLYAQCDVWLCGSCREGFHLPPLEAMACRCPVVSTRVGGPLDVVDEGVNGFLVDVGNSGALAQRLEQVLGMSEENWRAMSDAAYATATRYTWDDATQRFEAALRRATELDGKDAGATAAEGLNLKGVTR